MSLAATTITRPLDGPIPYGLEPPGGGDLLAYLLAEQSDLSAVERFSREHAAGDLPAQSRYYRSLLPSSPPGPGQQYGFEVDLDRCSGCKACVTACHNLNGLDEGEAWRDVGLLLGGNNQLPVIQHVTTACHHCLQPACYQACPVDAYEKDEATGIVRHLDDQCFGCQYCTLACPYDVPKYHKGKGIVRKCDMCSDRLAEGEAPACVQACPHEAIRIQIVDRQQVLEDCEAKSFLPGAPDPDYTLPTTTFKTKRVLPRNLLPADYYSVKEEHAHWPLAIMLVLTQLSVGAFLMDLLLRVTAEGSAVSHRLHASFSLGWGLLALASSTLHLGRPHLAFRAFIGLRHSWLSREIVAFGLFAPLAGIYAVLTWWQPEFYASSHVLPRWLGAMVVGAGLLGVFCSVMIYVVVRREFWSGPRTAIRFAGTTLLLGLAATLLTTSLSSLLVAGTVDPANTVRPLAAAFAVAGACKLVFEASVFVHLRDRQFSAMRRSATLMSNVLARATLLRFGFGVIGSVFVPAVLATSEGPVDPLLFSLLAGGAFGLTLAGELAERYLFFTAVVRQKMPGGLTL